MQFSNPFDNPQGQFYILRNDQQQYSLWPAHCDLPAGWTWCAPRSRPRLQRLAGGQLVDTDPAHHAS
ncbi:cytoplasmic protein YbdZ [Klebsiella pneumoniae]|uniref:Cytoplasmic protein YbdZ n=1 Tax=Klebsiella pneumoniae TaxID=573 RepID=A0A4P0XYD1_KLEPN|nr:cytoplasmic protein YbdZ [Klebsiella pneumoniae]